MGRKQKEEMSEEEISFSECDDESDQQLDQSIQSNDEELNESQSNNDLNDNNNRINDNEIDVDNNVDQSVETNESKRVLFPEISLLSKIKNKLRRREMFIKLKQQKKEVFNYFTKFISFILVLKLFN
jgi:hypothetical protein